MADEQAVTAATTTNEPRFKLKPKQWEALVGSTNRMNQLREAVAREQERSATESALILESFGLDPAKDQVRVDPETQELVLVLTPEENAAEKPKRSRAKKSE